MSNTAEYTQIMKIPTKRRHIENEHRDRETDRDGREDISVRVVMNAGFRS